MEKFWNIIPALLTALSVGGWGVSWFQLIAEKRKNLFQKRQETKEIRYKATILLMHALINFEESKKSLGKNRPDLVNLEELLFELETEHSFMALFASDDVLIKTRKFLEKPNRSSCLLASQLSHAARPLRIENLCFRSGPALIES